MKTFIKKWCLFAFCMLLWMSSFPFHHAVVLGNADKQAPSSPTALSVANVTRHSFVLNWTVSTDNVGVKEYRIYRNEKLAGVSATHSFTFSSLTLNTSYRVRVVALDEAGNLSKSSATLTVKTLTDTVAPQPPTALQASNVAMQALQLNWLAATDDVGVTRYEVYIDGVLKATNKATRSGLSTAVVLSGLKADTSYSLTVRAFDQMNNGSVMSAPLEVETLADTIAPLRVTGLSADAVTTNAFRLSWDHAVDNLRTKEYEVFRNGTSLGKTQVNSWSLNALQAGTTYAMTVLAYDESANASPVSQTLSVTTNAVGVGSTHKLNFGPAIKSASQRVSSTNIHLAEDSNLTVRLYNTSGQLLQTPVLNVATKAGMRRLNVALQSLGSGDYLLNISAVKANEQQTQSWRYIHVDLTAPVVSVRQADVTAYSTSGPTQASVAYHLSERANVSIKIVNQSNRLVRTVNVQSTSFPGHYTYVWDGKNNSGLMQPAGDYTFQFDARDLQGNVATRQSVTIVLRPFGASLFDVFKQKNGTSLATAGSFSRQNEVAFRSVKWAFTNGQINWGNYPTVAPFTESDVFRTELTHRADSSQASRSWSIRIGKGGNLYSIKLPEVGEISPPSFRQPGWNELSPWNDDGMTTTLNSSEVSNNDAVMNGFGNGYIHGSGMYITPLSDALNNKPLYSPRLAEHYDAAERSYATINWGLVPKPSVNRGDLLIYSKYRDVGNGVIELNYYYYNFGTITYDFAEAPWWMVRRSLFPDQIRGTTGANFEVFDRTYGVNHTFNVNSFAGWGASTQDATDPNAMTAAMVWGKDKDWSAQSALKNSGGDYWQIRTSAAAYGKVNDLARDGQLLTSVIFPLIKPGEGFHFRRYLVFGKLADVAQTAASLVDQVEYKRIEFASDTSGRLPLYETTRDGQTVLSTTPPSFASTPVGYSSPVPIKGSKPLILMKNTGNGQYVLSTDPYALAGKKPFVNPYAAGDGKYEAYQNRVIYQPYDGKSEWIALLGYVVPALESGTPSGYHRLSDATTAAFVQGEQLAADQLLLFAD